MDGRQLSYSMSLCCRKRGVEGSVKVNGRNIIKDHRNEFSRLSCYIMQEDALRPALTVKEAMTFVAHLRLGYSTSHRQKQKQVGYAGMK
jgi:ABC-type multidrug transport system ATPase subunit